MALLSRSIQRMPASATIAMAQRARALAAEGRSVIALSTGQPDFDVPEHVKAAAIAAVQRGENKYTPVAGIPALREAVARKFERENGIACTAADVIVGAGAKQVVANAFLATLDPGDEVIVPAPYWVSYPDLVTFCGAKPVALETGPQTGYRVTPHALAAALTPRTKWLVLNAPNNPTGAVLSPDDLAALAEVLRAHAQVHVLSDDIYEHILFDGARAATLAAVAPDLAGRILTVNGVSKAYAMMGWRIGFATGPAQLVRAMDKLQGQLTAGASNIAQFAALAALEGPQDERERRRGLFEGRRNLVVSMLNQARGLACPTPAGAFYAFPSIAALMGRRTPGGVVIASGEDFALELLGSEGVAIVAGEAFGAKAAFRLSFAADDAVLEEGCRRIQRFCASLT